jgi:hypothetical protein
LGRWRKFRLMQPAQPLTRTYGERTSKRFRPVRPICSPGSPIPKIANRSDLSCYRPVMSCFSESKRRNFNGLVLISFASRAREATDTMPFGNHLPETVARFHSFTARALTGAVPFVSPVAERNSLLNRGKFPALREFRPASCRVTAPAPIKKPFGNHLPETVAQFHSFTVSERGRDGPMRFARLTPRRLGVHYARNARLPREPPKGRSPREIDT